MSRRHERWWAVSIGSGLCPECGAAPAEGDWPGWWERFMYWLFNGSKAPTTLTCPNGHSWVMSVGVVLFRGGAIWPKWLRLPVEVFRIIRAGRSMEPVPMTYLMALGVGLILGLGLDLGLGWPWWAVAAGFMILVWLFFSLSAFRDPNDIAQQVRRAISPVRAASRDIERLEDAVGSGRLVGYGVASWRREKSIGGWSEGDVPESLTLRHGDVGEDEWVEVTTHGSDAAMTVGTWIQAELVGRLLESRFPLPIDPTIEDFHRRERDIQNAEPPDWQPISFRVADEMIPGQIAHEGSNWAVYATAGSVVLELFGAGVDPTQLQLFPIVSLGQYTKNGM